MKPADCQTTQDLLELEEQGLQIDQASINITSSIVNIRMPYCLIQIPKRTFRKFAEWYLEEQTKETCDNKKF